jgi:uncharacterized damage-inducible protein DinB
LAPSLSSQEKPADKAPAASAPASGYRAEFLEDDRAKVQQALKDSFAHFRGAILTLSDADADEPQKMFNRETTLRGALMMIDRHSGEHLGPSIAYARVNGVVPPWTEEFQQQQKPADKAKTVIVFAKFCRPEVPHSYRTIALSTTGGVQQ